MSEREQEVLADVEFAHELEIAFGYDGDGKSLEQIKREIAQRKKSNRAIIVDIDGTLALRDGRGPYEFEECGTDLPNLPTLFVTEALLTRFPDFNLIVLTGRENRWRTRTEAWLNAMQLDPQLFLMRETGDTRPDYVVKREMFHDAVEPFFDVVLVLDDRDSVVAMWRDLGLVCHQVADGDF